MDARTLRDLPRPDLQRLAKENNIKANLKSNVIIQLLLERHVSRPNSVASSKHASAPSRARRSSPANSDVRASVAPPDSLRRSPDPLSPPADINSQVEDIRTRSRSPSAETTDIFATPESSVTGTPEPEADALLLQRTVEIMAEIDRGDRQISDHITQLRDCVTTMRSKADDLKGFVQAERSMRIRMEDYFAHWVKTTLWWTYEEVWSGQVRVRDMNEGLEVSTSDEEDLEARDDDLSRQAQIIATAQGRMARRTSVEAGSHTDAVQSRKRQRADDSDNEPRAKRRTTGL